MKIKYMALVCFLVIVLSSSLSGTVLAQEIDGQQVTKTATNVDPTKGITFLWEPEPFKDSTKYEFVLARNASMTQIMVVATVTLPGYSYDGILDYGTTYFWRVRALEPSPSDWSATFSFQTKAAPSELNVPNASPYYGVQLLAPNNGSLGCPVTLVSFSWSPFEETSKYQFVLAKDAAMTQVIVEAEVTGTQYVYNGKLDYSTNYFWRVMAVEPTPSDWSATFSFQTIAEPVAPAPATPQPGMSCTKASAGSTYPASDISPLLLGAVLVGLVFASRQRPDK